MELFRIHGDNIVECERIIDYIVGGVDVISCSRDFVSLSCMRVKLCFQIEDKKHDWQIELFPGFNKSNRSRWKRNIFEALRDNGCFLDETPDAIISKVVGNSETILAAVEFCSALQAGNQAWQRSGRAYSVGRAGCPYIYIVDFVKYELDTNNRKRKALRFPNPAVPYSYISFSEYTNNFVAQIYVKSEEFQPDFDERLNDFDPQIFANESLYEYILFVMLGKNTATIENVLMDKNAMMVEWLSKGNNTNKSFNSDDWHTIYETNATTITHSLDNQRFKFEKSIAAKSAVGKNLQFLEIVKKYSTGMASKDLPFGLVPAVKRKLFATEIAQLYPAEAAVLSKISANNAPLVICMVKGFKPGGDDNRPDRGVLPLVAMLSSENAEVMTFIYGPLNNTNYNLLLNNPNDLARRSGFWRVFMSLSDFFVLDVPLLNAPKIHAEEIIDNTQIKKSYVSQQPSSDFCREIVPIVPNSYHEDDVDTIIHSIFMHLIPTDCFEGMCNPPGGDWSGMSVMLNNIEYRWLSLPRVSTNCKRPDHVIEIFGITTKPALLIIESKDRKTDLENNVGLQLKSYLDFLFSFTASVERGASGEWEISSTTISNDQFELISAVAYVSDSDSIPSDIFARCNCDMVFALHPNVTANKWNLRIFANTPIAESIKDYVITNIQNAGETVISLI